jgi:hypothetical protein
METHGVHEQAKQAPETDHGIISQEGNTRN